MDTSSQTPGDLSDRTVPESTGSIQFVGTHRDWLALPLGIRQAVKREGLTRLTRLRQNVQEGAGLPMPRIEVAPEGWFLPDAGSLAFAKTCPRGDVWAIELPASTLVVVEDDLTLRRILVHEFLHCFWYCTKIIEARDAGQTIIDLRGGDDHVPNRESDDAALGDPFDWFGREDAESLIHHGDDATNPTLGAACEKYLKKWHRKGLPSRLPPHTVRASRIDIPIEVIRKIRSKWAPVEQTGGEPPK
jgi:hypothetical protein